MPTLIRTAKWQEIRGLFSTEEKAALNDAVIGQTICPAGLTVDTDRLVPALVAKLLEALAECPS